MLCPKCGAENPDGATHCGLCYLAFVQSQQPVNNQQPVHSPAPFQEKHYSQPSNTTLESVLAPSEWVGSSPPTTVIKRRGSSFSDNIVSWVIVLVVIGGLAVGGYFVWNYFHSRVNTYTSTVSGLTFQYPPSWKETPPSPLSNQIATKDVIQNEQWVVDDPNSINNLIASFSMDGGGTASWSGSQGNTLAQEEAQRFKDNSPVTTVNIKAGPAIGGSATNVNSKGVNIQVRWVAILHDGKIYTVAYESSSTKLNIDAEWQKIENSIGFTK